MVQAPASLKFEDGGDEAFLVALTTEDQTTSAMALARIMNQDVERYSKDFSYCFKGRLSSEDALLHVVMETDDMYEGVHIGFWIVSLTASDRPIVGQIALSGDRTDRSTPWDLAAFIDKEHEGKRLVSRGARAVIHYAAERRGVKEVTAHVRSSNERSRRVVQSLGMELHPDPVEHTERGQVWRVLL